MPSLPRRLEPLTQLTAPLPVSGPSSAPAFAREAREAIEEFDDAATELNPALSVHRGTDAPREVSGVTGLGGISHLAEEDGDELPPPVVEPEAPVVPWQVPQVVPIHDSSRTNTMTAAPRSSVAPGTAEAGAAPSAYSGSGPVARAKPQQVIHYTGDSVVGPVARGAVRASTGPHAAPAKPPGTKPSAARGVVARVPRIAVPIAIGAVLGGLVVSVVFISIVKVRGSSDALVRFGNHGPADHDAQVRLEATPPHARVRTAAAPNDLVPLPATLTGMTGDVLEVEVSADGYEPKRVRLPFDPGTPDRIVRATLEPKLVMLSVDARPAGARVAVNGSAYTEPVFVTPGVAVAVDVIAPGFAPDHREVVPKIGAPVSVTVELTGRAR